MARVDLEEFEMIVKIKAVITLEINDTEFKQAMVENKLPFTIEDIPNLLLEKVSDYIQDMKEETDTFVKITSRCKLVGAMKHHHFHLITELRRYFNV